MGRPAGSPNKQKKCVAELCEEMGFNPFEILIHTARADYVALGYETNTISLDQRIKAATELSAYVSPKLRAIELSGAVTIDDEKQKQVEHLKTLLAHGQLNIEHKGTDSQPK